MPDTTYSAKTFLFEVAGSFSVVTLSGDMMVVVMLFSKVLPQSAVLRCCLRKLWIYCPPGQGCEHRKALMSNFETLQENSRIWAQ